MENPARGRVWSKLSKAAMVAAMQILNTFLAVTALLGWLPPLLCLLVLHVALAHGAADWPDIIFDTVFIGLYALLVGVGARVYTTWFKAS